MASRFSRRNATPEPPEKPECFLRKHHLFTCGWPLKFSPKKMLQWGNIKDTRKTTGKYKIPMENRPFTNLYTKKKTVMFHSYGKLPEGITKTKWFLIDNHGELSRSPMPKKNESGFCNSTLLGINEPKLNTKTQESPHWIYWIYWAMSSYVRCQSFSFADTCLFWEHGGSFHLVGRYPLENIPESWASPLRNGLYTWYTYILPMAKLVIQNIAKSIDIFRNS